MTDHTAPARVSFTRGAWAGLALVALLLLGLLGTQVALIEDQRSTTDRQLAATAKQADAVVPLLRRAEPLLDQTIEDLPRTQELTRRVNSLSRETEPLVQGLADARAPEQLQAGGALARRLIDADLAGLTVDLRRAGLADLAGDLRRADLPRTTRRLSRLTADVSQVTALLTKQRRLERLLVRSNSVLGAVRASGFVEKSVTAAETTAETIPRIDGRLQAVVELQRQTLLTQRELLDVNRELLMTAREARDETERARRAAERAAEAAERFERTSEPRTVEPAPAG